MCFGSGKFIKSFLYLSFLSILLKGLLFFVKNGIVICNYFGRVNFRRFRRGIIFRWFSDGQFSWLLPRDGTPLLEAPLNGPQKLGKRTPFNILVTAKDFWTSQGPFYQAKWSWYSTLDSEKAIFIFNFSKLRGEGGHWWANRFLRESRRTRVPVFFTFIIGVFLLTRRREEVKLKIKIDCKSCHH